MPLFHLISWCGNFVERHSFRVASSDLPETIRKLCLSTKFPDHEIRWNNDILRSGESFPLSWKMEAAHGGYQHSSQILFFPLPNCVLLICPVTSQWSSVPFKYTYNTFFVETVGDIDRFIYNLINFSRLQLISKNKITLSDTAFNENKIYADTAFNENKIYANTIYVNDWKKCIWLIIN